MSNQVFSNSVARYYANAKQSDVLTLIKSNVGPPDYGSAIGPLNTVGSPLTLTRLNGYNCAIVGSGYNYPLYQSPSTKLYYTLLASDFAQSRASLLQANVNIEVAVEVILPMNWAGGLGQTREIMINVVLMDGPSSTDYTNGKVVITSSKRVTVSSLYSPISTSGMVKMKAGQYLGVYIAKTIEGADDQYIISDITNGNPYIFLEVKCSFVIV